MSDNDLGWLSQAAFAVDSKHHLWTREDGTPVCLCGFVGNARKRTQTEHITAAVTEEYNRVRDPEPQDPPRGPVVTRADL